jgi:outer membrane protein assembly factor BamB
MIGTASSASDGECNACPEAPNSCPPPGATPCTLARCRTEPSPLDAPWPQAGRDAGRRSASPYVGPTNSLSLAWMHAIDLGAAFTGLTVGPGDALYAARNSSGGEPLGLLRLAGGAAGGAVAWSSGLPLASVAFSVGPWGTLLGALSSDSGARTAAVLSAQSGALVGYMAGSSTQSASALGEVVMAEDLSAWTLGGAGSAPQPPPPAPPLPSNAAAFLAWLPPYAVAGAQATFDFSAAPADGALLLLPAFANGTIFCAGANSTDLQSLAYQNTTGSAVRLWNYTSPHGALAAMSLAWDGSMVFVGSADGTVVALSAVDGSVQWERSPCPRPCTFSSSALGALSLDGDQLFMPVAAVDAAHDPAAAATAPTTSNAATAAASTENGFSGVVALDTLSGNTTWSYPTKGAAMALAVDASGQLFIGDAFGTVSAVDQGSGVPNMINKTATLGNAVLANGLALGESGVLYVVTNSSVLAMVS